MCYLGRKQKKSWVEEHRERERERANLITGALKGFGKYSFQWAEFTKSTDKNQEAVCLNSPNTELSGRGVIEMNSYQMLLHGAHEQNLTPLPYKDANPQHWVKQVF